MMNGRSRFAIGCTRNRTGFERSVPNASINPEKAPIMRERSKKRGLPSFAGGGQFAIEEFGGGVVGAYPIAPAEQVVNFVRDD